MEQKSTHTIYDIKIILDEKKLIVGDCWRYLGSVNKAGYGKCWFKGKHHLVHRVSAHIHLGLDLNDKTKQALHKSMCKFRDCWNPEHLYIGIHTDNMKDLSNSMIHCPKGHKLVVRKSGRKWCRICHKLLMRRRRLVSA